MATTTSSPSASPRSNLGDLLDIQKLSITESTLALTPSTPTTPQEDTSNDYPIPSIESPRTPGSPPIDLLDALTLDARNGTLSPPASSTPASRSRDCRSPSYSFGTGREPSPFTFRNLHNATPEPTSQQTRDSEQAIPPGATQPIGHGNDVVTNSIGGTPAGTANLPSEVKFATYNVRDEVPPKEPYFNPEFQKALERGSQVAGRIEKTLRTCDLAKDKESQIYGLMKDAKQLHKFATPAVCTIGMVGDSGAGKPSDSAFACHHSALQLAY